MTLEQTEFNISAMNEQHVACVLLLDTSGSMEGDPINNLNEGIKLFKTQSMLDEFAKKTVDVAIVEFNSTVRLVQDFVPLSDMQTPTLVASGQTSLGAGLDMAMNLIEQRKALYKQLGTPYFRPWIFLITDGLPTDEYLSAADRLKAAATNKKVVCWAVGVPGYSKEALQQVTDRVFELNDINFAGMFEWLSSSLVKVSNSNPTDKVTYDDLPINARVVPKDWD